MNFKDMLRDDLDEVFFDVDDGFAETISIPSAGIEAPAIIDYLSDPTMVQGGAAERAQVFIKKSDIDGVEPMQELTFGGKNWIIERVEAADDMVARLLVRSKERVGCV